MVIDDRSRRLVTASQRNAIQAADAERTALAFEASERNWYAQLRSAGLRLGGSPGEGDTLNVVGESHYLETLAGLVAALRVDAGDREVMTVAKLVREPMNRYDRNAVRVEIHGHLVGYLSREDASEIQPWLRRAERDGLVFVLARLGGGLVQDGQVGPIGVTLEELPEVFG